MLTSCYLWICIRDVIKSMEGDRKTHSDCCVPALKPNFLIYRMRF